MRRLRTIALALGLAACVLAAPARADAPASEAQSAFEDANQHYYKGEYKLAAQTYAQILHDYEIEDAVLYHNLGNAYFQTGAYGSAILYYRRGLRLEPDQAVAQSLTNNLDVARRVLQERYRSGSDKSQFIYEEPGGLAYKLSHLGSAEVHVLVFVAAWWLLFGLLLMRRLRPPGRGFASAAIPVGVIALIVGVALWARVWTDNHFRLGVVVEDRVTLREGPDPDAQGVDVPEGMEVRIVEGDAAWLKIELSNGRRGWVETHEVKQI